MAFFRQYHWILGLLVLASVITVMVGTPKTFFGQQSQFIYSNLSDPTSNQTYVRTSMDFGDNDQIRQFPYEIGEWTGRDYDVNPWMEQLGADVALMRGYRKPGTREIWFLAMQSRSRSSFHPPEVCYPAMGWEIVEETSLTIPGKDASWIEEPLYPRFAKEKSQVTLKQMLVNKQGERRLILYFYVKHATIGAPSDIITMIRISAITTPEGSYERTLEQEKELLLEFIPYMFDPRDKEKMIILQLVDMGPGGIFLILLSFAVPIAIISYSQIARLLPYRRRQPRENQDILEHPED